MTPKAPSPLPDRVTRCPECHAVVTESMCQVGLRIDGRTVPFHVGCGEAWGAREIPVLRVEVDGRSFVTTEPFTPEPGFEGSINWETMPQRKYHALREFDGF